MRRSYRAGLILAAVGLLAACGQDEEAVNALGVTDMAAYWSVRGRAGDENYIHPVVRFRVLNEGEREVGYVQAMAVFRRESAPEESWGSGYEYSVSSEPLAPGEPSREIILRSDANYISKDEPEDMFRSSEWEQVSVEIFLRAGASNWRSVAQMEVPQRLGAPGVEKYLEPSPPSDHPPEPPGR